MTNKAISRERDHKYTMLLDCFEKYDSLIWSEEFEPTKVDTKFPIWKSEKPSFKGLISNSKNWNIKELHEYKNNKITFKVENEKAENFYLHFANRNKAVQS